MEFVKLLENLLETVNSLDPKKPADQDQIKHLFNIASNLVAPCMGAIELSIPYKKLIYGYYSIVAGKTIDPKVQKCPNFLSHGLKSFEAAGKYNSLVAAQNKIAALGAPELKSFFAMIEYIKTAISVLKDKAYNTNIERFLFEGGKREVENKQKGLKKGDIVAPLLLSNFTYNQKTSVPEIPQAKLIDVLMQEKGLHEFFVTAFANLNHSATATAAAASPAAANNATQKVFGNKLLREYFETATKAATAYQSSTGTAAAPATSAPTTTVVIGTPAAVANATIAVASPNTGLATAFATAAASMGVAVPADPALTTPQPTLQFAGTGNASLTLLPPAVETLPQTKPTHTH